MATPWPRPRQATTTSARPIVARAAELFARQRLPRHVDEPGGRSLRACRKATLYHYYRDKDALLVHIADGHVSRLQALVAEVRALGLKPEAAVARAGAPHRRGIRRRAACAPRAHRGREVPGRRRPPAHPGQGARGGGRLRRGGGRAAPRAEAGRAGQADDHAAVRHDQLDVHLDEARRARSTTRRWRRWWPTCSSAGCRRCGCRWRPKRPAEARCRCCASGIRPGAVESPEAWSSSHGRFVSLHAAQGLDLEQGKRRPLRQHQPPDRRADARQGAAGRAAIRCSSIRWRRRTA